MSYHYCVGKEAVDLDVTLVIFLEWQFVIIKVNAPIPKNMSSRYARLVASYLHDCQCYVKRIHLLGSGFPVLNFNGTLSISKENYLPSPSFLGRKIFMLGLNTHNQSVDG